MLINVACKKAKFQSFLNLKFFIDQINDDMIKYSVQKYQQQIKSKQMEGKPQILQPPMSTQELKNERQLKRENLQSYQNTFCILARALMIHCMGVLLKFLRIKNLKPMLDLIQLKEQYQTENVSKTFQNNIQEYVSKQNGEYTVKSLYKGLLKTFKPSLIKLFFQLFFGLSMKILTFIMIQQLFSQVQKQTYNRAYLFAGLTSVFLLLDYIFFSNYFYQAKMITISMRSCIVAIMLQKILTLTQHTVNKEEIGKVTNMISNDFNTVEFKAVFLYSIFLLPVAYIAAGTLLVIWLGPAGLICLGVPILFLPLLMVIGKINSKNLEVMNKFKDKRVQMQTDLIHTLKQIKTYAWEQIFIKRITSLRNQQLSACKLLAAGRSAEITIAHFWVYFGGFLSLYLRSLSSDELDSSFIFSSFQLFTFLHFYNFILVIGISGLMELTVILKRLTSILGIKNIPMQQIKPKSTLENHQQKTISDKKTKDKQKFLKDQISVRGLVEFQNFVGYWNQNEVPVLNDINLKIKNGLFYGLCGGVGSGKTSLFQAILSELPYYTGKFANYGSISYFEQETVLFDLSIKENIIFGKEIKTKRYEHILQICCLHQDLQQLANGDNTLVGQRGISLSGGQKARVAFARALYLEADLYIFDDPLSAVDSKVAKHIFEKVFKEFLVGKTVILSTHQIHFLLETDFLIVMESTKIVSCKKPQKIQKEFLELLIKQNQLFQPLKEEKPIPKIAKQKIIELNPKYYLKYIFYSSKWRFLVVVLLFLLAQGCFVVFLRLLSFYEDQKKGNFLETQSQFWGLLGGVQCAYLFFLYLQLLVLNLTFLSNNKKIHSEMVKNLMHSKPSVLDVTHSGQLSNYFSNDIGMLDSTLFFGFQEVLFYASYFVLYLANIIQIEPYSAIIFGVIIVVMAVVYVLSKKYILSANQEELLSRTPIFTRLNQSSNGLIQIRLFSRPRQFIQKFCQEINYSFRTNNLSFFCFKAIEAIYSYIGTISAIILLFIGIKIVERKQDFPVFCICLIVLIMMFYRGITSWLTTQAMLVSFVRCYSVITFQSERAMISDQDKKLLLVQQKVNEGTGTEGQLRKNIEGKQFAIMFGNLKMRYRQDLPLVLKGINLNVEYGLKLGIVGRTGSGKSSIVQCLMRLYEPEEGSVYRFFGADGLKLGLKTLRKQIAYIPQTPFILKTSVKDNLDPQGLRTESDLWAALKDCKLKNKIKEMKAQLDTIIDNPNEFFSYGQKQLFCLARAILKGSQIIILDEATSNIDKETDRVIQKTIRKKFWSETIVTIAHRISTIADYDRIVVMDAGNIVESGHPYQLIQKKGLFWEMVQHSEGKDEIIEVTQNNFKNKIKSNLAM